MLDRIYFTIIPGSCVPRRPSSNGVGPFHGWAGQLRILFKPERKHESVTPSILTYKESSVSGHAHFPPAFASQSSVDTHIRKVEGMISMSTLAAMRQFRGAGFEQTAERFPRRYLHNAENPQNISNHIYLRPVRIFLQSPAFSTQIFLFQN